jgi:hypothetical protein
VLAVTEAEIRARFPAGLAHAPLDGGTYRLSAVLVPLEPMRGVWLTRRSGDLPNHAGQVAFPGGKIEAAESAEAAALREAEDRFSYRARRGAGSARRKVCCGGRGSAGYFLSAI